MLKSSQLSELKELLEQSQNPIFFYDNDADGLCSFLLLRRFLGKGKGVAIRSYPELSGSYTKKVKELNADRVFILDKPLISEEFIKEVTQLKTTIVIIDHHINLRNFPSEIKVFNAAGKEEISEPVTYEMYRLTFKKEDVWIAVAGCIADHYLPDFLNIFLEQYPEMWGKDIKEPFDALYKTEIGKIAQALNFGLKDSTSHVLQFQQFLIECKSPHDFFVEGKKNYNFLKKYSYLKKKYDSLIKKAELCAKGKVLFFKYSGNISMSSEISNELFYKFPDKYIVVAYVREGMSNISLRGKNVLKILNKVLKEFPDATGGGHLDAVGAKIKKSDLEKFKEIFEREASG